jgi:SOS-response transcriptional repressor LexA
MNETQKRLISLSQTHNIRSFGLRELMRIVGAKNPQTVKYHLQKLEEQGLLANTPKSTHVNKGILGTESQLITIPILGAASAGPATQLAEERAEGYLKVSSKLLRAKNTKKLYALRVVGNSMNRASIFGTTAESGDFAIVDSSARAARDGDYIVAVVDGLANVKKFKHDRYNNRVVLISESSEDYSPIFIHEDDERDGLISGKIIQIIKGAKI